MKNLLTLTLALCLTVVAVAQQPVQRSLITKRTASWCSNCGSWGWAFMEGLIEDNEDQADYINAHYSGDLQTDVAIEFTNALGGSGQPNFFFGENKLNVLSNSYPTQQILLKELIEEASSKTPRASTGTLLADTFDGKIEMTVRTEFYEETDGDFYLSILVLEDGIINNQAGQGATTEHKNILRASATPSAFGEIIASGAIAKNTQIETSFSMDLDPTWNENSLTVVFVIWEKIGSEYVFINTYSTSEIFSVVSTSQHLSKDAYTLDSNLVDGTTQLTIGNNDQAGDATVQLLDMQGRIVKTIWNGAIQSETNMLIENNGLAAGTYLISIQVENRLAVERIVFLR